MPTILSNKEPLTFTFFCYEVSVNKSLLLMALTIVHILAQVIVFLNIPVYASHTTVNITDSLTTEIAIYLTKVFVVISTLIFLAVGLIFSILNIRATERKSKRLGTTIQKFIGSSSLNLIVFSIVFSCSDYDYSYLGLQILFYITLSLFTIHIFADDDD